MNPTIDPTYAEAGYSDLRLATAWVTLREEEERLVRRLDLGDRLAGRFLLLSSSRFTPQTRAGCPSAIMYGGISCTTFEQPPMIAIVLTLQNWWMPTSPR